MEKKHVPIRISSLWPQLYENHVASIVRFVQRTNVDYIEIR